MSDELLTHEEMLALSDRWTSARTGQPVNWELSDRAIEKVREYRRRQEIRASAKRMMVKHRKALVKLGSD